MGGAQSSKKFHYQRISDSNTQPLLQNQPQSLELEDAVQANMEENSALKKEIRDLKSNLSRLQTKFQTTISRFEPGSTSKTKGTEGCVKSVEKLKKSVKEIILGCEAQKRINSAELSKQGKTILQIEDKNLNLEKKIADMDSRINEISSIMVDMAALLSEINHNSSKPQHHTQNEESFNLEEELKLKEAGIINFSINITEDDIHVCFLCLIFVVSFILGFNI